MNNNNIFYLHEHPRTAKSCDTDVVQRVEDEARGYLCVRSMDCGLESWTDDMGESARTEAHDVDVQKHR